MKYLNRIASLLLGVLLSFSACQEPDLPSKNMGEVKFTLANPNFFKSANAGGRTDNSSTWKHIYAENALLNITNKTNGQEYTLQYNPNDFLEAFSIILPYGNYAFESTVEGGVFESFLPYTLEGEFTLNSQNIDISLEASTDYGLVTVKNQFVKEANISASGVVEEGLNLLEDESYHYVYVEQGTLANLKIKESYSHQGTLIERDITVAAYRHYNFVLQIGEGTANIIDLVMGPFEYEEEVIQLVSGKFDDANGIIKCQDAEPGNKGLVNGKLYEAVDRALLIQRRDEGADLTCVCTSLVTNMRAIFAGTEQNSNTFNPQIGNWDVSNVTDMTLMFYNSLFNQPIGNWDVSNVKDMRSMFANTPFNQNIGNWDVSNVLNMGGMFSDTPFNQNIGDWNVSKVNSMYAMFRRAESFNQPIGNWDVSSVMSMMLMFADSPFNQPIGNWDVSNVLHMGFMFSGSRSFNQPISNWDVKNVTYMRAMFQVAEKFNQPLGDWDVGNVRDMGWMFAYAGEFNQDLSNWNISNVDNMDRMFAYAIKFNSELGNWDVGKVTLMNLMFFEADSFNYDIGNWDVSNVQEMIAMFALADSFDQNIGSWKLTNLRTATDMFNNSGLSRTNYESTLLGWSQSNNTPNDITLGAENIKYCDESGRISLINDFNWVIEKDLKTCD